MLSNVAQRSLPALSRGFACSARSLNLPGPVATSAFPFLPSNHLQPKPRNVGLTEIRGPYYAPVTQTYLNDLLSDWGAFVGTQIYKATSRREADSLRVYRWRKVRWRRLHFDAGGTPARSD